MDNQMQSADPQLDQNQQDRPSGLTPEADQALFQEQPPAGETLSRRARKAAARSQEKADPRSPRRKDRRRAAGQEEPGEEPSLDGQAQDLPPEPAPPSRRQRKKAAPSRPQTTEEKKADGGRKPSDRSPTPVRANYFRSSSRKNGQGSPWWNMPVCFVCLCIIAGAALYGAGAYRQWQDFQALRAQVEVNTFYPGITVDGVDMSHMTLDEALQKWGEKDAQALARSQITLDVDGQSFAITPEAIGFTADSAQVLTSAYSLGRYGLFSQRSQAVAKLGGVWGRDFTTRTGYDEEKLYALVEEIAAQVSTPAVEATIEGFSEEGGFVFTQGTDGLVADPHELMDDVTRAMAEGKTTLSVERRKVSPGRSVEDLKKVYGTIAQSKTGAKSSSKNRLTNLKLACEALNGLRIEPGQTFSFNETLGKRTAEKGYKSAPALSGGSHTSEIGGGICQVATTLFNAVAKADMEIVKRHPHSIPSSYVARGLDATVDWPNQDFKFKNNSDTPIYLSAKVTQAKEVIVAVHGRLNEDGVTIRLKGVTNETIKPDDPEVVYTDALLPGEQKWITERRNGYKVTTYRIYYNANGKEIDRELLFKSTYGASRGKVQVGK